MEFYPLPQPDEVPVKEREDAMGGYLMMFAAVGAGLPLPIVNLIASVIYFYLNRSNSRFVLFHTYQALISQIPVTLMNAVVVGWGIRILLSGSVQVTNAFLAFVGVVVIVNLAYFVVGIIAAVKARKGRMYYYWFFGKLAYIKAFSIKDVQRIIPVNQPPRI